MKKADRLFQLVTLLQGRRSAITAQEIGQALQVSVRTVYRDIQGLAQSGVMIDGGPGIGYLLRRQSHVPPLMFTADEVLAMLVGSQMVQAFTDPDLARAAQHADQKIRAVLSSELRSRAERSPYRIPVLLKDKALRDRHTIIRMGCEQQRKIHASYVDEAGHLTERTIWPLGIVGLHGNWMLVGWCDLRNAYRTFRFDRIQSLSLTSERFSTSQDLSLAHYFSQILRDDPKTA